ncbi:MAG: dTDP-4-dehydrorhamnose 3,5-epimerase [Gemmatimonadales bacterium]
MIFTPLELAGAMLVDLERHADERGFFARTWCQQEFRSAGLSDRLVQASISHNRCRGTLRGMHYQEPPHAEEKLVRCTHGAIWDVIIDLRPASPTYLRHLGVELCADTGRALFIPTGFAHGFQTLRDDSQVFYQMSHFYAPAAARGIRWNDPRFGIEWPATPPLLHPRDGAYPDF